MGILNGEVGERLAIRSVLGGRVPEIFCHSKYSQNVTLTFFAPLYTDTIVGDEAALLDQSECAGRELA